jgi:hypothetical protein
MRLVIEDIPRSPNGPKGLLRMHWAARRKYNQAWYYLVSQALGGCRPIVKDRAVVSISQMRKRKFDPDNLVASVKPILDALVKLEIIEDDSSKFIDLECSQVISKEKLTVIEIKQALKATGA